MLLYCNHISREMLRANPDKLFVFGDNQKRRGYGGQAKEMRGEPMAFSHVAEDLLWRYPAIYQDMKKNEDGEFVFDFGRV